MSSRLEDDLLFAVRAVGLPEPEREYQFERGCCGHPRRAHRRRGVVWCTLCPESHGPDYIVPRRWRFDFAWPGLRVAAECEGGIWTGGRHVRGAGYEADAEKYNAAALLGWVVLRFTRRQITSGDALEQIERAIRRAREGVIA